MRINFLEEFRPGVMALFGLFSFPRMRLGLLIWLWLVFGLAVAMPALGSQKKGVGLADLRAVAAERIVTLNVAWYYTWKLDPIPGVPAHKFVPMVWGGRNRLSSDLMRLLGGQKIPYLLAINEPDRSDQANMSVDEVVRLWPKFANAAESLSTPATAGFMGPWATRFLKIARQRGLKIDFVALHIYGPPDAQAFLNKVDEAYRQYGLPLWITEFAVADWRASEGEAPNRYSENEVLIFMKEVLPELEKRPFVQRYAWFGAGFKRTGNEAIRTSRLFDGDGHLTALGQYYSGFSWPADLQPPVAPD